MNLNINFESIILGLGGIIFSLLSYLLKRMVDAMQLDLKKAKGDLDNHAEKLAVLSKDSMRIDKMSNKFEITDSTISKIETNLATLVNESKHTTQAYNSFDKKLDRFIDIMQVNQVDIRQNKIEIEAVKNQLSKQ